jgi:RNA polymerase sigma factor (sigma-70 family)
MSDELSELAAAAQAGSREALDGLVRAVQRPIYNLALRMLQRPADAEDATQEILIKLVTYLAQFRGESAFSTWIYRVASSHLLNQRPHDAASLALFLRNHGDANRRRPARLAARRRAHDDRAPHRDHRHRPAHLVPHQPLGAPGVRSRGLIFTVASTLCRQGEGRSPYKGHDHASAFGERWPTTCGRLAW